jgi:hypothetical protein
MEELAALAVSVAERLAVRSRPLRKREFETAKVSRGGDRVSRGDRPRSMGQSSGGR